ncbi:uncharacterized protein LOC134801739 [Cydia splendana]|uniref:uncharacterized protein LOC134801739 n=1 Tax=Cydia splendana TaxID=1100963 RepID=UPI00300D3D88
MKVTQLVSQKLSEAIKAKIRKRVNEEIRKRITEGVSGDDEGVDQLDADSDQGVDGDKTTLNGDAGSGAKTKGKRYGNGKGSKKVLCIYAPENLRYCVSQLKEL